MIFFSKELLNSGPYKDGTVIETFDKPGEYTLKIKGPGFYEIEAVSAGTGGRRIDSMQASFPAYAGATGAYYKGILRLKAGTYTVNIGAGVYYSNTAENTSIGEIFILSGANVNVGGNITARTTEVREITYTQGLNRTGTTTGNRPAQYIPDIPDDLKNYGYGGDGGPAYPYSWYSSVGGNGYLKVTYRSKK